MTVQPGTGWTLSEASAASSGIWIRTDTVLAVSLSSGTRKATFPKPPGEASPEETPTWADAVDTEATRAAIAVARTTRTRAGRFTELLFIGGQRTVKSTVAVVAVNSSTRTLTARVQVPAPGMAIPSPT